LWDTVAGTEKGQFGPHGGGVLSLSFDPAGHRLATAAEDNQVRVWDSESRQVIHIPTGLSERVNDVRFDPRGTVLAAGGEGGSVYPWGRAGGVDGRPPAKLAAAGAGLRVGPAGAILGNGWRSGMVATVDVASGRPRHSFGGHNGGITSLDFSPNSQ